MAALGRLGEPRAVPALAKITEQRDWLRLGERGREREATRRAAVEALGTLGGQAAEAALRKIVEGGDGTLAELARDTLDGLANAETEDTAQG